MKRSIKWLSVAVVIIASIAAISRYSKIPISLAEGSVSATWLEAGFYEVGSHNINEQDDSRTLQKTTQTPLNRRFIGKLWFPMIEEGLVAPGKHPLIIYQHRFGGSYNEFSLQANLLASKGYLVAAVNSPSPQTAETLPLFVDQLEDYAADTRFLLDTLSQWNTSPETLFYSRVDLNRIGIVGRSLGSVNALISGFHPTLKDERIALVATIGGFNQMFNKAFFDTNAKLPLLSIGATGDTIANYRLNSADLIDKHANTWLIGIKQGRHSCFSENPNKISWLSKSETLNCETTAALLSAKAWGNTLNTDTTSLIAAYTPSECSTASENTLKSAEQLHLSQLALTTFIEMHFAGTQFERTAAADFLDNTIMIENPALQYIAPIK